MNNSESIKKQILPYSKNENVDEIITSKVDKNMFLFGIIEYLCSKNGNINEMNLICQYLEEIGIIKNSVKLLNDITNRYIYSNIINNLLSKKIYKIEDKINITSRYNNEFIEFGYLGEGGFGTVYKVLNKLDNQLYAIKKIPLETENNTELFKEAKLFSKLDHKNIVRYYSTWLEYNLNDTEIDSNNEMSIKTSNLSDNNMNEIINIEELDNSSNIFCSGDLYQDCETISYLSEKSSESSTDTFISNYQYKINNEISLMNDDIIDDISDNINYDINDNINNDMKLELVKSNVEKKDKISMNDLNELLQNNENKIICMNKKKMTTTLYIQMQLCDGTLRNYLEKRNYDNKEINMKESMNIIHQLIKGIHYLHSKNIVHRDLNPNNIFIHNNNNKLTIKIGDFGLAKDLDDSNINNKMSNSYGLELYISPEQKKGQYSKKSDIYSLGIICYEILTKFSTQMERIEKIKNLINNIGYAEQVNGYNIIIKKMISLNAENRPSADELLKLKNK